MLWIFSPEKSDGFGREYKGVVKSVHIVGHFYYYEAVVLGEWFLVFWKNVVPLSTGRRGLTRTLDP
jgi:hypothetical protein